MSNIRSIDMMLMGHSDYSMLVKVYGRWIDSESPRELERIWAGMQNMAQVAPNLPQKLAAQNLSGLFK